MAAVIAAARPLRSRLRDAAQTLVLAAIIFVLARGVVQTFRVEQHSMEPTIRDGQYLLVNRLAYAPGFLRDGDLLATVDPSRLGLLGLPERGDIVVFTHPRVPDTFLVKRVVALPGETVEVRDGTVYVDGRSLQEPYLDRRISYHVPSRVLAPGDVFVLGDNRDNSYDSHVFGPIAADSIVGKAVVVGLHPASVAEAISRAAGHPLR